MRGIALTQNVYDEQLKTYPYLTGGVDDGTEVRVVVDVYNFSINTVASGVKVNFAYQQLSPDTLKPVGKPMIFATATLDIGARDVKQIAEVWNTKGLAGKDGTPYRFEITIDNGGQQQIHGTTHETGGYNRGIWPWAGSAFYVFKAGTTKASLQKRAQVKAPGVSLALLTHEQPMAGFSHIAEITIDASADDPAMRQLVLVQPPEENDGIWSALASRTLWGVREGKQVLRIPVLAKDPAARSVSVWLSPGTEDVRPILSASAPWYVYVSELSNSLSPTPNK
jgi:hypothetical protein